jgi:hypothetical protein
LQIVGTHCELLGSVGIVGKRRVEATSQDSPLANPGDGHTLGGRTEKWKDKTRTISKIYYLVQIQTPLWIPLQHCLGMIFNKVIASTAVDDFLGQLGYTELRGKMKNLLCSPASLAPLCKTRLSHMWSTLAIIVSSTSSRRRWRRLHNWQ